MPIEVHEGQAADELGIDRLELYLAAAKFRIGRYDALTHLLVFHDDELDALAAHLGIARRPTAALHASQQASIPDPEEE